MLADSGKESNRVAMGGAGIVMKGCCRPKSTVDVRLSLANLSQLLLLSHKRSHEDEERRLQWKGEGEFDGEKEYKDVETSGRHCWHCRQCFFERTK